MPTHQGRAAENVLFSALIKEGIYPKLTLTHKGHIEFRRAHAVDCTVDVVFETETYDPFKGNVDQIS